MANPCETCPLADKIELCCSSNPDTGKTKLLRFIKSKKIVTVCDKFMTNGDCEVYYDQDRPEDCRTYVCPKVYAKGSNSEWTRA